METPVRITRIPRETFYQELIAQNALKNERVMQPQLPLHKLSKFLGERTVMPADTPVPECVTCGACCAYLLFVPVNFSDSEKLSEFVELTLDNCEPEIAVDRVLPRQPENGHCVNLYGSPGEQIGCTIYEDRPQVCRAFDAGSDRCHEYRRIYGFEPRLTEMQIVTALCRIESVDRKERIVEARIVERERTTRFSFSAATGAVAEIGSIELKIVVFLEDEIPHEIHRFDPENEIWFETDFLTLGLAEAKELIASRSTRELI